MLRMGAGWRMDFSTSITRIGLVLFPIGKAVQGTGSKAFPVNILDQDQHVPGAVSRVCHVYARRSGHRCGAEVRPLPINRQLTVHLAPVQRMLRCPRGEWLTPLTNISYPNVWRSHVSCSRLRPGEGKLLFRLSLLLPQGGERIAWPGSPWLCSGSPGGGSSQSAKTTISYAFVMQRLLRGEVVNSSKHPASLAGARLSRHRIGPGWEEDAFLLTNATALGRVIHASAGCGLVGSGVECFSAPPTQYNQARRRPPGIVEPVLGTPVRGAGRSPIVPLRKGKPSRSNLRWSLPRVERSSESFHQCIMLILGCVSCARVQQVRLSYGAGWLAPFCQGYMEVFPLVWSCAVRCACAH